MSWSNLIAVVPGAAGIAPHTTAPASAAVVLRDGGGAHGVREAPNAVVTRAGGELPSYSHDLYDRVHVTPAVLELGNVIGEQQYSIRAWNAHRRAMVLSGITATGDDGIRLEGGAPPQTYAALQERTYTLTIETDGPPIIDARYTLTFGDETLRISISGARIVAWTWPPDWSKAIVERLSWLTEIHESPAFVEQAVSRRPWPRQEIEFTAGATGRHRAAMDAAIWGWGARTWAVPIYADGAQLLEGVPGGASELLLDTQDRRFAAGGLAQLQLESDPRVVETVEIRAVHAGRLELTRPTRMDWSANAWVRPMMRAYLAPETNLVSFNGRAATTTLRFVNAEPAIWAGPHDLPTYRGLPVVEWRPDWSGEPEHGARRSILTVDNTTGIVERTDQAGMPQQSVQLSWLWPTRAASMRFRGLLYYLRGRSQPVWIPSGHEDLVLVDVVASAAESMDVEAIGYATHLAGMPGRRDVRIELHDGRVLYRRITGAQQIDDETERLAFDSPPGITFTPADVRLISYLSAVTLASDSVELAFWTGETTMSTTTFKGWRHDL